MASDPAFREKKRKPKPVRESVIEAEGKSSIEARGGISYKFVSPGRNGVPDRIDLFQIPPEHREIVARYIRFVEYKRPGGKPDPHQLREHSFLSGMGFKILVIDTKQGVLDAFN